jgi:hypothetical protein
VVNLLNWHRYVTKGILNGKQEKKQVFLKGSFKTGFKSSFDRYQINPRMRLEKGENKKTT